MTQNKSYKKDLVQYRLESAREMLHDARVLEENEGSPASIVNRAYYSVFYAALALLVAADVEPNKHAGVLAKFDELFVRQGTFSKEISKIIHYTFDMRQAGDYLNLHQSTNNTYELPCLHIQQLTRWHYRLFKVSSRYRLLEQSL